MPKEGMPPEEPSLLAAPLRLLTRLVLRFPVPVLALAIGAAVLALGLSGSRLGFRTSRLELLNPKCNYNRLWIDYINEFGEEDDVVVVVEGAGREQVVPVLEEISRELEGQSHLFHAVLHEVDLTKIRCKGLHYLDLEDLRNVELFLNRVGPITHGQWARLNVGTMVRTILARLQHVDSTESPAVEAELDQLSASLLAALGERAQYASPWPGMSRSVVALSECNSGYLLANEGRLGFVLLRLTKKDKGRFAQGSEGIDTLRRLIDSAATEHPGTEIGLTGLPVMENDEMRASQVSMMEASLLALVGVACLFVAGFGGLRHPMVTVAALLLAMAWSFGYITLAIGHLNILSIAFGVILIGLGIDFGVHYAARYLQLRNTNRRCRESLLQTASGVGPGILTGAVTTAIAFFAAGLTEFTGVAELGIIAGGGILLCLLATLTVLPAMIYLMDTKHRHEIPPAPLDVYGWMRPLFGKPRLLLGITLAGTAVAAMGIGRFEYDHNLLNLQPDGLESVELEKKLLNESDQSVWFALSMVDGPEDLRRLKRKYEQLDSVERVEDIARFFPTGHEQKLPIIARIHRQLADLCERPPKIPVDAPADLGRALAFGQSLLAENPRAGRIYRQLGQIRDKLRQMSTAECFARIDRYQQRMAGDLLNRLHILQVMSNPEPPKLTDLPQGLVTRFVGQRGRHLLKIYAKGDIWDMEAMEKFVRDVRSVDPKATGNPLQTYEASRQMKRSYEQAAWYALAAILVVLYFDFRSLRCTLLAMVPLGLGMLQLFGVMGILGIPGNPANMIVLPLILGIGIDDGVHVVYDFRRQKGRYRMSPSTASAVLITSLTTMIGFGSLMIASHRGLQSLGRVLTIGVSCCLFTSMVVLPALLTWITRNRRELEEETQNNGPPAERVPPPRLYRHDPGHPPKPDCHPIHSTRRLPEKRDSRVA